MKKPSSHCYLHEELRELKEQVDQLRKELNELKGSDSLSVKEVEPMRKKQLPVIPKPLTAEEVHDRITRLHDELDSTQHQEVEKVKDELSEYLDKARKAILQNNEKAKTIPGGE